MINLPLLIENLEELSSKERQMKLWLSDSNDFSSFTEAICGVFDDAGLSRALDKGYAEKNFSSNLLLKFRQLNHAVGQVPEDLAPLEIIEHLHMEKVRILATEILALLNKGTAVEENTNKPSPH